MYITLHVEEYVQKWNNTHPLKLKVLYNPLVVTPDVDIEVTDLQKGNNGIKYKKFLNSGNGGITFKIKVIVYRKETWTETFYDNAKQKFIWDGPKHVTSMLKNIYEKMKPVRIVSDFIDIKNGTYILTKMPSREQTYPDYSVWELEFTTYTPMKTTKFKNDNTRVKKAIKSAKAKQVSQKNTSSKDKTATKNKFKKCDYKKIKYSKTKKVVDCVKYLQKLLKRGKFYDGKIDGWYGKDTTAAVKKFQKKYKKKYHLQETGKIDKKTFDTIIKV